MKNKMSILSFLILFTNLSLAQSEEKIINETKFTVKTISRNDTEQTDYIELYRNNKKLLSHTLYDSDGDCSSETIELGGYDIKQDTLIFYSYWASGDRMNKYIYPYGFRKQIYNVADNGVLNLVQSQLYIETYIEDWKTHKGMKYLLSEPKTENEKALLKDYVSKVEKIYAADVVFGKEKDTLEIEVREKLKDEIYAATSYWKEAYGENCKL